MSKKPVNYQVMQGLFDRWYIFHPTKQNLAWSGSKWVPTMNDGYPSGGVQICNFATEEEATEYMSEIECQAKLS